MTTPRRILHVDMDAFYASVEERDDPQLAGQPVVVGGSPRGRGVVSAANYRARRYGVHSAMPAAQAYRLCPQAVFIRPRMAHYAQISREIRALLARYTPVIEPLALDEAFLDVTASERLFGSAREIGQAVRDTIRRELALPASVGVAGNKFLAKLACTRAKPDGLLEVPHDAVQAFLDPLPVRCLWGVGEAARAQLALHGIETIADLRQADVERVADVLGRVAERLVALARGEDDRPVVSSGRAKSISHETTFEHDVSDAAVARAWVFGLAEQVAARARDGGLTGRTVRVKIRYADFSTRTRARTLDSAVNDTRRIANEAVALLEEQLTREPGALRLLGVGLSGFDDESPAAQPDLFDAPGSPDGDALDAVTDGIAKRFGKHAVSRARTLLR